MKISSNQAVPVALAPKENMTTNESASTGKTMGTSFLISVQSTDAWVCGTLSTTGSPKIRFCSASKKEKVRRISFAASAGLVLTFSVFTQPPTSISIFLPRPVGLFQFSLARLPETQQGSSSPSLS